MTKYKKILYFTILLTTALSSCSKIIKLHTQQEDGVVARIGDEVLYKTDIDKLLPDYISKEDSIKFTESFIKQWATDILIYQKAEQNISNKEEIDNLVSEYRKNLVIYYYKQNMVNSNIKEPTSAELVNYYESNKQKFILTSPAIKGILITMPKDVPQQDKLKNKLTNKEIDIEFIEKYSIRYAYSYQLFLDSWRLCEDIPEVTLNDIKIDHKGLYQISDSNTITILQITDIMDKGLIEPFEIAKKEARNMLIHNKRVNYINSLGSNIYDYAIKHNQIIIYNTTNKKNEENNLSDTIIDTDN